MDKTSRINICLFLSKTQNETIQTPSKNNQTIKNPLSSLAIELSDNSPFLNGDHDKVLLHVEKSFEVMEQTHLNGFGLEVLKLFEKDKVPATELLIGLYKFQQKYPKSILIEHNQCEYDDICSALVNIAINQQLPPKERNPSPTLQDKNLKTKTQCMLNSLQLILSYQ